MFGHVIVSQFLSVSVLMVAAQFGNALCADASLFCATEISFVNLVVLLASATRISFPPIRVVPDPLPRATPDNESEPGDPAGH